MKTKLGISVGIMGALAYFACFFGGWIPMLLVAGYVLIFETDTWLRKTVVTAVVLTVSFSLIFTVLNIIPELISLLNSLLGIFDEYVDLGVINKIFNFLQSGVNLVEKAIFLVFGFMAIGKRSITLGFIDKLVGDTSKQN